MDHMLHSEHVVVVTLPGPYVKQMRNIILQKIFRDKRAKA